MTRESNEEFVDAPYVVVEAFTLRVACLCFVKKVKVVMNLFFIWKTKGFYMYRCPSLKSNAFFHTMNFYGDWKYTGDYTHSQCWCCMEVYGQLSHPSCTLALWEGVPSTYWIGGRVGPRASLDTLGSRRILSLPVAQIHFCSFFLFHHQT